MSNAYYDEQIVLTPTKRSHGHTTITMERVRISEMNNRNIMHVAGGDHTGIIITKDAGPGQCSSSPPELFLSFKVMLKSSSNNRQVEEDWLLKFWFKVEVPESERIENAQAFCTELLALEGFPKDSVDFIKRNMKLMQLKYPNIQKVEVEMKKLGNIKETAVKSKVPVRDPVVHVGNNDMHVEEAIKTKLSPIEEKLLDIVEAVYPNSLSLATIAKSSDCSENEVTSILQKLETRGLLKRMNNGNYIRITGNDSDVKMVKQLPMVPPKMQPIIAIITAHYCEKLAVDTMIDNKETFVKFKTEGESNVYTLGTIGGHRVVSTKLPAIGHDRGPMIAAGSTTTRLLGSFGRVEYVFLVGVGGGVAHYTDYSKHVRLGDVVISTPPDANRSYIYMYCEKLNSSLDSTEVLTSFDQLSIKTWCPPSMQLQQIAMELWKTGLQNCKARSWEQYILQGLNQLQTKESSFCRPSPDTDKLYMTLGENELIEVGHPQPAEGCFDPRTPGMPVLHFGAVGSGRVLMHDDTTRLEFADHNGLLAFDTEFDTVVESIFGNRKDNYIFIRGIADYKDGTKKKEWQPYAALASAAVMKAIICNLVPCE